MAKFNLLTTLSLNAAGLTAGLAEATSATNGFTNGVKTQGASITDSFKDISTMGIGQMKRELMSLKNISFAGKSKEDIAAINMQIGKLVDEMGDLRSMQNAMGSEFGSVMAGGLQTLSAVGEVGLGVATMFGASKEQAEKYQQAMTTLIGVTQGLGVIENAVATRQFQNIALRIQSTVVTTAHSVATGVATAAQWLYNAALGVTVAIVAGVIVVAAALAVGIYLLVNAFSANTDAANALAKAYENLDRVNKNINESNAFNIRILKAKGATENEIAKAQLSNAQTRQKQITKEMDLLGGITEKTDDQKKAFADLGKEYIQNGDDIIIMNIELDNVAKKKKEKVKEEIGAYSQLTDKLGKLEDRIKNIVTQGGVVTPAMIAQVAAYRKQIEDATLATNKLINHSELPAVAKIQGKKANIENELKHELQLKTRYANADLMLLQRTAKMKDNIAKETSEYSLSTMSDSFGQIAGLFKENTLAYKAMAIAQATMATYLAGAAIMANTAKLGPIAMAIAMGATIATGLMNVAQIAGVQFANGGIVGGNSFSGDRISARLNSGEMVLNAGQQANLFAMANGNSNGSNGGVLTARVSGSDLIFVLNNQNRKTRNTR